MLSKRLCAYTEDNALGGLLVKRSIPAIEEKCKLMVGKRKIQSTHVVGTPVAVSPVSFTGIPKIPPMVASLHNFAVKTQSPSKTQYAPQKQVQIEQIKRSNRNGIIHRGQPTLSERYILDDTRVCCSKGRNDNGVLKGVIEGDVFGSTDTSRDGDTVKGDLDDERVRRCCRQDQYASKKKDVPTKERLERMEMKAKLRDKLVAKPTWRGW